MTRSRGMALVQALLIVAALAAVATALMLRADRARARLEWRFGADQAGLYLDSGVELLRRMLPDEVVHPGQDWAQPRDGMVIDRGLLAWEIADLQGRFNLNLLRDDTSGLMIAAFRHLAMAQGVSGASVAAMLARLDAAEDPMALTGMADLVALPGDEAGAALQALLTALPDAAPINVNTVSEPVLDALLPSLGEARLRALLRQIAANPVTDIAALADWAGGALGEDVAAQLNALPLGTGSRYFEARLAVRLDSLQLRRSVVIDTGGASGAATVLMSIPGTD